MTQRTRQATASDHAAVDQILIEDSEFHVELEPKWMTDTSGISSTDWADYIAKDDRDALVYEDAGEIRGVVLLSIGQGGDPGMDYQPYGNVDEVAVGKTHRGRGIGKKLMEAANEWAKVRGLKALILDVWKSNERAIALYENVGYRPSRQRMFRVIE
jgi:ribosomal protein S18 acetylase RimI-like enzyme